MHRSTPTATAWQKRFENLLQTFRATGSAKYTKLETLKPVIDDNESQFILKIQTLAVLRLV